MGAPAEDDNFGDVDVNESASAVQDPAAAAVPLPILPEIYQQIEQNIDEPSMQWQHPEEC